MPTDEIRLNWRTPPRYHGLLPLCCSPNATTATETDVRALLADVMQAHLKNSAQIDDMWKRYLNDMPIRHKCRLARPEINNIVVENRLWELIQFKLGYENAHPRLYTAVKGKEEDTDTLAAVGVLNKCSRLDSKEQKDNEQDEWKYVCGTSYRLALPLVSNSPDKAPYYTAPLDPRYTGIIRSSDVQKTERVAFTYSLEKDPETGLAMCRVGAYSYSPPRRQRDGTYLPAIPTRYDEWEVKGNNPFAIGALVMTDALSDWTHVAGYNLTLEEGLPIIEYRLNPARMGYVALLASLQDAINNLQSSRMDGVENFIESLLVFVNCAPPRDPVTREWQPISSGQFLAVKGTENAPASVQYLVEQLDQSGTQIAKDDLLDAFYEVGGIPSRNAKSSGGDTGEASYYRDGWGDTAARAIVTEKESRGAEVKLLEVKLNYIRDADKPDFRIGGLTLGDVDIEFPRDRGNNLLTKVQSLDLMIKLGVDGGIAFQTVQLFSDPNGAWEASKDLVEAIRDPDTDATSGTLTLPTDTTTATQGQSGAADITPTE